MVVNEQLIDQEVEKECHAVKNNKTSAEIGELIKNYENDPALTFAVARKMNQLELMQQSNDNKVEIRAKEALIKQLNKEFIGWDKIRNRKN